MEIKINKEIRNYTENIYFGLSLRQFLFSVLACISAVVVYFLFKNILPNEVISWLCILVAIPSVVMGFVTYNGMKAEIFIKEVFKYYFLIPKYLVFNPSNYYYGLLKGKGVKDV